MATGIKGYSYGGPNPIFGSTVSVYTTGYSSIGGTVYPQGATADGYGVATLRQTTTSSATDGSFSFPGGYTCPAHQFAYITSSGGVTGSYSRGTGAAATAVDGIVTSISVATPGIGFTATPTVLFSSPDVAGGALATASATLNPTSVSALHLTSAGGGYTTTPGVTISGGGGSGATATATIVPTSVASATVTAQGEGYTSGQVTVTFSDPQNPGGVTATGYAFVSDIFVTNISITNPGSGYTTPPTITISGPLSGPIQINAAAVANMNPTTVASVTLTSVGSGYTSTPTVSIPGGSATVSVDLVPTSLAALTLTNPGYGYQLPPNVTVSGPGGSGATGLATVDPTQVGGFTGIAPGSGYTNTPVVTFSAPPSGATAAARAIVSSGAITGLSLTNPGSGYVSAPSITITDQGGNISAVLVAALGRCEDLFANTNGGNYVGPYIYINEISTTAAAYALGNFAGPMIGSGTSAILPIGAPVTNNSTYAVGGVSTGCVAGNPVACTTTQAAGLAHAFLNAANLANVFSTGITPVPSANTTIVGNTLTPAPIVPTQLINSLANSMVGCVNSGGNLSPGCATYLAGGGVSGTPATDVFSAVKYMASNPKLLGAGATVAQIVNNCSGPACVYSPNLNGSTPNDLAVAIVYPSGYGASTANGVATGLSSTLAVATDINDNVFATNASGTTSGNLVAISSNGLLQGFTPDSTGSPYRVPNGIAIDAANKVYVSSGYTANLTQPIVAYTAPGGALPAIANGGQPITFTLTNSAGTVTNNASNGYVRGSSIALGIYPGSIVTDRAGNVWFGTSSTSSNLWELPAGSTAAVNVGQVGGTFFGVAVDPYQNVWAIGSTGAIILQNTAPDLVSIPTYAFAKNTATTKLSIATTVVAPAFGQQALLGTTPSFFGFSTSTTTSQYLYKPLLSAAGVPSLASAARTTLPTTTDDTASLSPLADGQGTFWTATAKASNLGLVYRPANLTNTPNYGTVTARVTGCYFTSTCTSVFTSHAPQSLAIDSTGSIWTATGTGGQLIQFIGSAAPTWPLLSLGTPGVRP